MAYLCRLFPCTNRCWKVGVAVLERSVFQYTVLSRSGTGCRIFNNPTSTLITFVTRLSLMPVLGRTGWRIGDLQQTHAADSAAAE
ncbi:MAG: hypothetical protein JNJ94_04010 [Chlorobi bacterium]|jgi:hypothetical protein|nr:hypothetical protein [Chlorobiota bacterium]